MLPKLSSTLFAAAFLMSLTSASGAAQPAGEVALRWSELDPVLHGRRLSVQLTDGAILEGKQSSVLVDSLSLQVTNTTNSAQHPKGATILAKSDVAQIMLKRENKWKGRIIGLLSGGAAAGAVAGTLHAISVNEAGGWSSAAVGVAAAGGSGTVGIGYLVGWLFDRRGSRPEQVVRIIPD